MDDVIGIQLAQYTLQTRPAHHHRPQLPSTRLTQLLVTARTTKKSTLVRYVAQSHAFPLVSPTL